MKKILVTLLLIPCFASSTLAWQDLDLAPVSVNLQDVKDATVDGARIKIPKGETAQLDAAAMVADSLLSVYYSMPSNLASNDGNYLAQTPEELQTYYDLKMDYQYIESPAVRAQLNLEPEEGIIVVDAQVEGEGHSAGFRSGDLVLQVDAQPVDTQYDLVIAISEKRGETTEAKVRRNGAVQDLTFQLKPVEIKKKTRWIIGVSVDEMDELLKSHLGNMGIRGAVVTSITEDSPAKKMGLKIHDIITKIADEPITNLDQLRTAVQKAKGRQISIDLIRAGNKMTVELTPKEVENEDGVRLNAPPLIYQFLTPTIRLQPDNNLEVAQAVIDYSIDSRQVATEGTIAEKLDRLATKLDDVKTEIENLKQEVSNK